MSRKSSNPRYLKHASGQARVIINGRTHYLGRHGSAASKQRYDTLISEWLASNRCGAFGITSSEVRMSNLIRDFIAHCTRHYGAGGNKETEHARLILRVVATLYADLPACHFGPAQWKAIRQQLLDDPTCQRVDEKQVTKPLSRPYINCQMKRLNRMCKWSAGERMLPASIYDTLRLIPSLQRGRTTAPETERILPISIETIEATLPHCSTVVAAMIRVQLLTGCRPAG